MKGNPLLAGRVLLLLLMAAGVAAIGINDATFSPQAGVERGKAYSQSVLLLNSPNRDNHFVVTVAGEVGAWVTKISPSDFNLTANQQKFIELTIAVPANATFGANTGTVTATATDPAGGAGIIEATRGNLYATVAGSIVCGDGVCDPGESSSNCCTDCPSTAGGGGVSYGSWYCSNSYAKARIVSNSSYVCNSQTKAYEYITTNATETSQCESNTVCSGGNCIINQTVPVCGNNICESGESSSNCCTDCPTNAGGAGVAYGSWYCKDSGTKARVVSTSEYKCSNQTRLYGYVTTNSTETQACPSGQTCLNGDCATTPTVNATPVAVNATRNEFYWNVDWIDMDPSTSSREDSLAVSPGQAVSGKFAYTLWNGPNCRGGCDCIDEIVLGLEGDPKYCFYAGIPWCYPGNSGETKFSFNAPEKAGTYSLYYSAAQAYTCDVANDVYRTSTSRKLAGKLVVSGTSAVCTDSDGGNNNYVAGYVAYNGVSYKDYCAQPVSRQDGTAALDSVSSCSGSGCSVFEYWCGGTQGIESQSYSCPQGCKDGACQSISTGTFKIADISGKKDSYAASGVVALTIKGVEPDGTPAEPDEGFSVQYGIQSVTNDKTYGSGNANYRGGYWYADFQAPSSIGTYNLIIYLYCSRDDAACAKNYGKAAQVEDWSVLRVSTEAQPAPLELSLATDKSSYAQGEQVRISSKTHVSGNLVDAYVKGLVVRPDGGSEELVFARESCVQPECKPGQMCIQLACAVQAGYLNAFYNAGLEGAYYIKATASYGNSLAESSAKFAVGVQKKAKLSAWLENYQYNAGDTVRIFAKLVDSAGVPVLGADVSARVYWAGQVRPYSGQIVGIEQSAKAEKVRAVSAEAMASRPAAIEAKQASPTGYAIATIASAVERQVASGEAGITYEEEMRIRTSEQTTAPSSVVAQPSVRPDIMPIPPKPEYGYVKLEYNPKSGYEGTYAIPSDAGAGTYKVAVSASFNGQYLSEHTAFSVGGEDYYSFESKARQAAAEGKYGDCKDSYLTAARKIKDDQKRMLLDIEKAGICARLGNLPNSFYSEVGKIVEDSAADASERYVLLGIASQYYELGGDFGKSRALLEKAAGGIEGLNDYSNDESKVLSSLVLAKYYSLLGKGSSAAEYYGKAAGLFAAGKEQGSEAYLASLFSARLYAKAGDLDSAKKQYLDAAEKLSEYSPGSTEASIFAFLAGDSYEKAGEKQKAQEQYEKVISLGVPDVYGASDTFFAYSTIGRSYERLGEKEKAREQYKKGLERLLQKDDSESAYFAAGLSGYLGDYDGAKKLCSKTFGRSLSEENNIGKLTFMNAYCYGVLGDSVRAKKGCDLNSLTPQGEMMVFEHLFEPFPPPVSYCSQSVDIKPPKESCGNGVVDAGETSENCCADTGCAFGDTCSKALDKCVKPVNEISQETILDVLLRLEDARIKLDTLEGKALAISKYYSGKDQPKSDAWAKAANIFEDAKSRIDGIKKDLKDNREKITEETLEGIRQKLEDVRGSLKDAIDAILEAV